VVTFCVFAAVDLQVPAVSQARTGARARARVHVDHHGGQDMASSHTNPAPSSTSRDQDGQNMAGSNTDEDGQNMAGCNPNSHPYSLAQHHGGQSVAAQAQHLGGHSVAGNTSDTPLAAPFGAPTQEGARQADDEILPVRPSPPPQGPSPPPQGPDAALAAVVGSPRGVRGVSWIHDEREVLCSVYVDATLNAEVGIDQRLDTFKEDYSGRFRARLPDDMPRVERRRSRSTSAIHKELSYNIFPTVDRFKNCYMAVLRYKLTGNPSPADVCNAALAKYHGMSPYEGFKPEVVATLDDQPLRLWNVLKKLDRLSGAATMEALGGPRRLAPDSAEEEDEEEDLFNVPTSSTYARAKKQRRQSGFQERPIGTKAAKAFSRIEAALQRESVAHTTALNSIAQSAAERSTVAFWSSPMAANTEEGRAWWAREASRRLRDERDGHPVANTNAPDEAEEAEMQQAIDATAAAVAVSGRGRGGRRGGGVGRGAGRSGRGRRGRGGARGRGARACVRRGAPGQRERRALPLTSDDEEEAGSVTETDSDAGSPAPELDLNDVPIDDFEEYTVAPPPPPPTTMTAPSASIEDAASAAAAMVLATATLRSSSDSGVDDGGEAGDGDKGDSCSGAAPGGRARRGRAGVTGSRPPLPPTLRAASARGRSRHAAKKQLFLDRARANGMSVDECIVNGMDWGSSSDGDKDGNDNGGE